MTEQPKKAPIAPTVARGVASAMLATGERLEPITAVAAAFGVEVCAKSAIRWCLSGRKGIRLPSVKLGRQRFTTRSAFVAWLDATNQQPAPAQPPGLGIAEADEVLASFGLPRGDK
jgi:hypothetical protein